jgi:putative thioredoxin
LLVSSGDNDEALALVARIPESAETRRIAALARLNSSGDTPTDDDGIEARLTVLLDKVKDDEEARQAYLDLLEAMDLEDPRRVQYRRALSSRLF